MRLCSLLIITTLWFIIAGSRAIAAPEHSDWTLYPRETKDCSKWIDGSRGETDGISFLVDSHDGELKKGTIKLAVFVPPGVSVDFINDLFYIVGNIGHRVVGKVIRIDWRVVNVPHSKSHVTEETLHLKSRSKINETLYSIWVHFRLPWPYRFDFHVPDIQSYGEKLPVRIYAFRYFRKRGTVGLCL